MNKQLAKLTFNNLIYGWNSLTTKEKAKVLFYLEEKCKMLSVEWECALNKFLQSTGIQDQNDQFKKLELTSKLLEKAYSLRTKYSVDPDFKNILKLVSESKLPSTKKVKK